jgi:hypothetical protein
MKSRASGCLNWSISRSPLLAIAIFALLASVARADDLFYVVTPDLLKITEGAFPTPNPENRNVWPSGGNEMRPAVVLDGAGEAYLQCAFDEFNRFAWNRPLSSSQISFIALRVPNDNDVTGRLFIPKGDRSGTDVLKFIVPAASTRHVSPSEFYRVKQIYYRHLAALQYPGSAYFRHEARQAAQHVTTKRSDINDNTSPFGNPQDADDTVALFGGGRAVSESLQFNRVFPNSGVGQATIDVNSIPGISVTPMDWTKKNQGLNPKIDPLAALIPADQPAIFLPNVAALIDLADEADRSGTPILTAIEARSQDSLTRQRYEKQLGLSLNALGRLLGPNMVKSAALTASDPYLRTGTDIALLLETDDPAALKTLLTNQLSLAAAQSPQQSPSSDASFFASAVAPNRTLCCYMAALGNAIVVTNSVAQFQNIQNAFDGKSPALSQAPEYTFFRDRYKLGDGDETAFIVLTDATIRRWCGPRWRIADSRRTRAAAILSELQAQHIDELVSGNMPENPILHTDFPLANIGELRLTSGGVASSTYGSLDFMTPIAEMQLTKVTRAEADMYKRWREGYENNWRWFFDPIAARLGVHGDKLTADVTIMPLIAGTEYAAFMDIAGSARIGPDAADPHPDLAHFVLALDKNSQTFHPAQNYVSNMVPSIGLDPFSWLGQWVAIYADDDPFWEELAQAKDWEAFGESNFSRFPIAIDVDVSNGFKLTAFVVAMRAFIEQTSPQMTSWESMTYKDQPYVKVSPTPTAIAQNADVKNAALYYAISGDAFIITPNERVLQRALERRMARLDSAKSAPPPATKPSAWLGESVAAKFDRKTLDLLRHVNKDQDEINVQDLAWQNLPILNEYKRLYPDRDPILLHEKLWGIRLVDPAGGQYVWNETWHTMESSIYGSPYQPKQGPAGSYLPEAIKSGNFGLTFEEGGLRGAAVIDRVAPKN